MCPFQNGSSTSATVLNNSTESGKLIHLMIDVEKARVIEWVRVIWWYFARIKCGNIVPGWLWIVLSVPRTWLIVWFPEVVDRQNLQVCRAAHYCVHIVYMHENASWVFSVLSSKTDSGLKKGKFQLCFSRASRREPHNLRDRKVGSQKQIIAYTQQIRGCKLTPREIYIHTELVLS